MLPMKLSLRLTPLFILIVAAICCFSGGAKAPRVSDADRAKAAYIFLEASSRVAENQYGPAYYMLARAAELNPDDDAIAAELGKIVMLAALGDSADFARSYDALKRLFFNNPADVQNGYAFIKVAQHLNRDDDVKAAYRVLMDTHPGNPEFALNYAGYRAMDYLKGDTSGPREAFDIYDRLEAGTGITDLLTIHRLHTLSVKGDTAGMINQIRRFTATSPLDPRVNFYTGSMYDMIHLPDSAIVYYTSACLLDSTFGPAYLARAEHYLAVGDSARYDVEVIHALESPSLEFEAKYEILSGYARSMYTDTDRRATFLRLFRNMLDIHPGEASLHYLYGAYLGAVDSVAGASEQFGYAMDLDPEEEVFARYRLQTAVEAGDTVAAINTARTAMGRFNSVFYPISAASLLQMSGKVDTAVIVLRGFDVNRLENDYQKSMFEQTFGDVLYAAEQKDSAFAAYDRALVYNPDNAGVLNNVAYFMAVENRELDKAERYAKRALLAEPDNPTYIDTYAWVLFRQKDYPAARRQIDKALDVYSRYNDSVMVADSAAVAELAAEVMSDEIQELVTGQVDGEQLIHEQEEVAAMVDEIQAPVPEAEIYDHAGDIYFMNGEPDIALNFWKEALRLSPDDEKIKKKVKNKAYFFD